MKYIKNCLCYLAFASMAACSTLEPTREDGVEKAQDIVVIRVPVYVMPNCELPRPAGCQWIDPPSRSTEQPPLYAPASVKGIAL